MIRKAKRKIVAAPTPMAGLALGIASLGWCWENVIPLNGYGQWLSAAVASVLLVILAIKFLFHNHMLREELAHPVAGSVVPTFAMGVMVVSNSVGQFYPVVGDTIWLIAVALHVVFLVSFVCHRVKGFELHQLVPGWFVPPVGIIAAGLSFSGNPILEPIAYFTLIFGMVSQAIMLPIMINRFIFTHEIPDAAKPTIAIMAAPVSVSLAGYLTVVSSPSPVIIALLFGIAVLMTVIIYLALFKLLRLPFSPGFAAFTFPTVIGATALFKTADWMAKSNLAAHYVQQVTDMAMLELLVATVVVSYVSFQYVNHLLIKQLRLASDCS